LDTYRKKILLFISALISIEMSAVSLAEFYLLNELNPILPSEQAVANNNSSITILYDQKNENISGNEAQIEIVGELKQSLASKESITLSLQPGKYNLSAWGDDENKIYSTIDLKQGQHKIWLIAVFEEHKTREQPQVTISI
tara:strand:+ start:609 stop:1031 length:423 start_codon:yes stop_codon:yes gene_type:complete